MDTFVNWFHTTLVFFFFVFLYVLFFIFRVRKLPSFSRSKRRYQILKSYFPLPGTLVIKKANIRHFTNAPSWIVFQKDRYYDKFFTLDGLRKSEEMGQFFHDASNLEKQPFDSRVLVFEDTDFGILTPLVSFFWPVLKVFEINGPDDKGIRLVGIDLFDLENDDSQEIIIYWLSYHGGSGGNFYPLVVKFKDDDVNIFTYFPLIKKTENMEKIEELRPREFDLKINGLTKRVFISEIHTDNFWFFQKDSENNKYRLLFAYPQHDSEYHFGPRSWYVVAYKFQAGHFVFDKDYVNPFLIPKGSESWKNLDTNNQPLNDMRKKSVIFRFFEENQKTIKSQP